jgi:hypothetical protein
MDSNANAAAVAAFNGKTDAKNELPSTNYKAYYKYKDPTSKSLPFYIGPKVEVYGVPCINPSMHPLAPVGHYSILKVIGADCNYFSNDITYSKIADTDKEWNFYKDNE